MVQSDLYHLELRAKGRGNCCKRSAAQVAHEVLRLIKVLRIHRPACASSLHYRAILIVRESLTLREKDDPTVCSPQKALLWSTSLVWRQLVFLENIDCKMKNSFSGRGATGNILCVMHTSLNILTFLKLNRLYLERKF